MEFALLFMSFSYSLAPTLDPAGKSVNAPAVDCGCIADGLALRHSGWAAAGKPQKV